MILTSEEQYLCLTDDEIIDEIIELRNKENRCVYCGTHLKTGYEDYECWGRNERVRNLYCPRCQ